MVHRYKKYHEDYEPMSMTLLVRVQHGENLLLNWSLSTKGPALSPER